MRPLTQLDQAVACHLRGLLFDLDDTLLDHGCLSEAALAALYQLKSSGLALLPVTGRPAAWGDVLLRLWPVDGVVTENGAVAHLPGSGAPRLLDEVSPELRAQRRARLASLVACLRAQFPELQPASDVPWRHTDYTFDIGETRQVAPALVEAARAAARAAGARTVRSSVHLHVSFDGSDKGSGALRALALLFGADPTEARSRYAFIGDSENDEPGFSTFHTSIGVANLRGRPTLPPRYVTLAERSQGFVELAEQLCRLRASAPR